MRFANKWTFALFQVKRHVLETWMLKTASKKALQDMDVVLEDTGAEVLPQLLRFVYYLDLFSE